MSSTLSNLLDNLSFQYKDNSKALQELQDVTKRLFRRAINAGDKNMSILLQRYIPKSEITQFYAEDATLAVRCNIVQFIFDSNIMAEFEPKERAKLIKLAMDEKRYIVAKNIIMNAYWEDLAKDQESLEIINEAMQIKSDSHLSLKDKKQIKDLAHLTQHWIECQNKKPEAELQD